LSLYNEARNLYEKLKDIKFNCKPNLGLDIFKRTGNLGSSASGMSLGLGEKDAIPVFVKLFSKIIKYNNGTIKIKNLIFNHYLGLNITDKFIPICSSGPLSEFIYRS
jgi:hypothetical protein